MIPLHPSITYQSLHKHTRCVSELVEASRPPLICEGDLRQLKSICFKHAIHSIHTFIFSLLVFTTPHSTLLQEPDENKPVTFLGTSAIYAFNISKFCTSLKIILTLNFNQILFFNGMLLKTENYFYAYLYF